MDQASRAANATHVSQQGLGAGSHFSATDRAGQEEERAGDPVSAPLFSSSCPTACNHFTSSSVHRVLSVPCS